MNWFQKMVKKIFRIEEADNNTIHIKATTAEEEEILINKIWYRGDTSELQQLYEQIDTGEQTFWGKVDKNYRKIHTGLPAMIVDTLADIVVDDLNDIKIADRQDEWNNIAKENNFKELIKDALIAVLWGGDGAFKWSIDEEISQYPIIEFFPAERVEYEYKRGRLVAIIFKTQKLIGNNEHLLIEKYEKNSITYKVLDKAGNEVDLNSLEMDLKPITNKGNFVMAAKFQLKPSDKYEGRGKSIFSGKTGNFDAFDEVWSQWIVAVRKGQLKTYIPENLLPRDPNTGMLLRGNDFQTDFVSLAGDMAEGSDNKVTTTQGDIQHEALLSTYITALDQCLTGLISPSTLGIDTKKIDNAEATREKEKTTLYKRNQIIDVLIEKIKEIVEITFKTLDNKNEQQHEESYIEVSFGGYANPSFEAKVETVSKASVSNIMSIEAQVEELWGDEKDVDWKKEEVERLKKISGIYDTEETAINFDNHF